MLKKFFLMLIKFFLMLIKFFNPYPVIAGNVARTFCDAYEFMTLNPRLLNFKECRDALLGYTEHDWSKAPLKWEFIADLCLNGFPTK